MRIGSGTIAAIVLFGLAGGLAAQDTTKDQDSQPTAAQVSAGAQALAADGNETATTNGAKPGDSHVRIVRLSEAQGKLAMDRGTGKGYEQVMQNMPIVEGARLETDDGYAEVEFEDGSTMRLAPDSRVEFQQLVLRAGGVKASTVKVERGTVYVNLENSKDNEFTVKGGQATMAIAPSTHMRLEVTWPKNVLAVFAGNVQVQSGGTTTAVEKKQSATLDATDATKIEVTKKIAESTYDGWDKQSVDYHKRYASAKSFAGGGYGYGVSDLNYYGSFINGPCGAMWQPYFVSAAWDPYANGVWALYPGAGYSWVSPYPWGWLPYHTGAWSFCPGMGWGWQPGGAWRGLVNVAPGGLAQPLTGKAGMQQTAGTVRPVGPPRPPAAMSQTMVMENRMPLVYSRQSEPGNFVFQRDSAGLGVPRGSLGELKGFAGDVNHHGSMNMPVVAEPTTRAGAGPNAMHNAPVTLRQAPGAEGGNWHRADAANGAGPQSRTGAANNQGTYQGAGNSSGASSAPRTHTVDPSTTAPTSAPEAGPRASRPH